MIARFPRCVGVTIVRVAVPMIMMVVTMAMIVLMIVRLGMSMVAVIVTLERGMATRRMPLGSKCRRSGTPIAPEPIELRRQINA